MSTEQNKASFRRFIEEAWNKGNFAATEEIASPGLVLHFMPPGTPSGAEPINRFIASVRAAFPDISIRVEDQFAEGDRIVTRWTMRGTQRGPYSFDMKTLTAPSGKTFSIQGIDICRFDGNGKWTECWSNVDRLGQLQQLGVMPAVSANPS